jgi:hypothetical protein
VIPKGLLNEMYPSDYAPFAGHFTCFRWTEIGTTIFFQLVSGVQAREYPPNFEQELCRLGIGL